MHYYSFHLFFQVLVTKMWTLYIYFFTYILLELIMAKYILMCSVNYLSNFVVAFMVHHCGLLIVIICIPWRNVLRKIWNVMPYMTHCNIISMLSECFPLELSLKLRGINLIKHIAAMAYYNPFSVYSNNCNKLADKYGANFDLCADRILNEWNNSINEIDLSKVTVL